MRIKAIFSAVLLLLFFSCNDSKPPSNRSKSKEKEEAKMVANDSSEFINELHAFVQKVSAEPNASCIIKCEDDKAKVTCSDYPPLLRDRPLSFVPDSFFYLDSVKIFLREDCPSTLINRKMHRTQEKDVWNNPEEYDFDAGSARPIKKEITLRK